MENKYSALFLRDGNSTRSILARFTLNKFGRTRFRNHPAGSKPIDCINLFSPQLLKQRGNDIAFSRSNIFHEFKFSPSSIYHSPSSATRRMKNACAGTAPH